MKQSPSQSYGLEVNKVWECNIVDITFSHPLSVFYQSCVGVLNSLLGVVD